jgi:hypothetical protein
MGGRCVGLLVLLFFSLLLSHCVKARPTATIETLTGGLPSQPAGYIYITLHRDVWFLYLTESGGLVCFVTVGGVDVYAVERISMCIGFLVCVLVSDMLM